MKKTLAIYKSLEFGFEMIRNVEGIVSNDPGYVRISEPKEVDFALRSGQEQITDELAALDKAEEEVTVKALEAIRKIKDRKQELLSITSKS